MEKTTALSLYELLGIQLTVAERERVMQHPTDNIRALLAFGLGLEAEDRGDFQLAGQHYTDAVTLDPRFQSPQLHAYAVGAIAEAQHTLVEALVEKAVREEGVRLETTQAAPSKTPTLTPATSATPTTFPESTILHC